MWAFDTFCSDYSLPQSSGATSTQIRNPGLREGKDLLEARLRRTDLAFELGHDGLRKEKKSVLSSGIDKYLDQGLAILSHKGPGNKYFRLLFLSA